MQVKIERKVGVLDLGSNTFNIKFVTFKNREVRSIFKYKKYINIIASTNSDGNIQKNKERELFQTFDEFKSIIDIQKPDALKVIATNSFRRIKDKAFVSNAEAILGYKINIISSDQEGEFVFKGVSSSNQIGERKYFILDIGGSSTEIIKVSEDKISKIVSLQVGSVFLSNKFIKGKKFLYEKASEYVAKELEREGISEMSFKNKKPLYGTSGSFKTAYRACQILMNAESSSIKENVANILSNTDKLDSSKSELKNYINPYRINILPSCLIILDCILHNLGVSDVYKSSGGLREGVIDELIQQD
jgi:exopolyphosphatase/guanosine-5'-triphosphate,3'-diphosphate pyrophosphatase|tara:strand:- start:563 stop:1474 length:912 start_codon:yes stop_codon:yes gene_type:complete